MSYNILALVFFEYLLAVVLVFRKAFFRTWGLCGSDLPEKRAIMNPSLSEVNFGIRIS